MFLVIRAREPPRLALVVEHEDLDALRAERVDELLLVDATTGIEVSIEARPDAHAALRRVAELLWPALPAAAAAARARAEADYHDPRCPERACDRGGAPYRGPAVYCSLTCAEEDA